jgi:prevent-host-death family protein
MYVSIREFRAHLSRYLNQVRTGQSIEITWHRKVVARVIDVPPPGTTGLARLLATGAGQWVAASRPGRRCVFPMPADRSARWCWRIEADPILRYLRLGEALRGRGGERSAQRAGGGLPDRLGRGACRVLAPGPRSARGCARDRSALRSVSGIPGFSRVSRRFRVGSGGHRGTPPLDPERRRRRKGVPSSTIQDRSIPRTVITEPFLRFENSGSIKSSAPLCGGCEYPPDSVG